MIFPLPLSRIENQYGLKIRFVLEQDSSPPAQFEYLSTILPSPFSILISSIDNAEFD